MKTELELRPALEAAGRLAFAADCFINGISAEKRAAGFNALSKAIADYDREIEKLGPRESEVPTAMEIEGGGRPDRLRRKTK